MSRVDLKLLFSLQVLLEERSVTRAAERLFVSQPAMSKTLLKLKDVFNDPLFHRTSYGLVPTPKAEALAKQLPGLLDQFQALIDGESFNPATFDGQFRIALPQIVAELILPELITQLCELAPKLQLLATDMPTNHLEQLATGKLDFIIHRQQKSTEELLSFPLGAGDAVCLMRKGHPLNNNSQLTLDDYLHYPHIRVFFPGMTDSNTGIIDQVLDTHQLKRRVVFVTTHLTSAIETLMKTDCLMVGPSNFTDIGRYQQHLHAMAFPDQLPFPQLPFVLLQHQRTTTSQAHEWLRERIRTLAFGKMIASTPST